ncbi:hypothetical protein [Geothrix sp.]|uniref:hypothetical protein n=1 Tax=Geothrix sp. TaxID=1962974 RepID=UPI0025B99154|nr:hypothetical protein [Geothrix sp.]
MSDPSPADQPPHDALRSELETWLNQQNQVLLEEVIATWQGAVARFRPDGALLDRLRGAIPPRPGFEAPPAGPAGATDQPLASALDLVEGATSQGDLLKRLLDALVPLVERSALFVLKQGLASLYAHRGFEAGAPLKPGAVVPPPDLESVIQGLGRSLRKKGPGYAALLAPLSPFEAADMAVFPLRHKRKTVALLLVDSGLRQGLDHPEFVRALVLAASATLASLAAGKEDPSHTQPGTSSDTAPGISSASAPTQVVPESIGAASPQALDPRTRAAAERLARVLVDDVELYFPEKVTQARVKGNLYRLLRDELERSRATFVDRFGESIEVQHRIFTSTVIHHLCEGDASKLGEAPWA